MKKEYRLIKAFGANKADLADLPNRISGTRVSRLTIGKKWAVALASLTAIKLLTSTKPNGCVAGKNAARRSGND